MKNIKIAIGCIVQWYEVEMYHEYVQSVINAVNFSDIKDSIIVDICFYMSENIEQLDTELISKNEIYKKFQNTERLFIDNNINFNVRYYDLDKIYTIADYRREFNDKYCQEVDVLMWGESDALLPKETFQILDILHQTNSKNGISKYISFFGTNKMWDDTWLPIEYSNATNKPFLGKDDNVNWWGVSYITKLRELYTINGNIEELDVHNVYPYKFNGCGLVIAADVIKSGVNIPRSIMLVHEDTAFQNSLIKFFNGSVPQFIIKNVYLAHNRRHPNKRLYVKGENDITNISERRGSNKWYQRVWKYDHDQAHNLWSMLPIKSWNDVFQDH